MLRNFWTPMSGNKMCWKLCIMTGSRSSDVCVQQERKKWKKKKLNQIVVGTAYENNTLVLNTQALMGG